MILGASSGFGEATAIELARAGMNILGVHLDRRDKLPHVEEIQEQHPRAGARIAVLQLNASDDDVPPEYHGEDRRPPGRAARHRCGC